VWAEAPPGLQDLIIKSDLVPAEASKLSLILSDDAWVIVTLIVLSVAGGMV
jgi:hypothetical protein